MLYMINMFEVSIVTQLQFIKLKIHLGWQPNSQSPKLSYKLCNVSKYPNIMKMSF